MADTTAVDAADCVLVDWLGRGGIAQTTAAWARVVRTTGAKAVVVSRSGRELAADVGVAARRLPRPFAAVDAHRRIAVSAAATIRRLRPQLVVIQNPIIPTVEMPTVEAAAEVGARLVISVHDHCHHSRWAGTTRGRHTMLAAADQVCCHSAFVAERLAGTRPVIVPHPIAHTVVEASRSERPIVHADGRPRALTFGVLRRRYKGSDVCASLAAQTSWHVVMAGVGARPVPGATTIDRFLGPGELASLVESSEAVVLPYRSATQSGAVALAQALGTVPVVSRVGGVPEQVEHGVDGLLLAPGAPDARWAEVLEQLDDVNARRTLEQGARRRAVANHTAFEAYVTGLLR